MKSATWARRVGDILREPTPIVMPQSDGKALPLLKAISGMGADLVVFPPSGGVPMHKHPGDHMLFCVQGSGWVILPSSKNLIRQGQCYLIEGGEPHGIEATDSEEFVLLVVGNQHIGAHDPNRLEVIG